MYGQHRDGGNGGGGRGGFLWGGLACCCAGAACCLAGRSYARWCKIWAATFAASGALLLGVGGYAAMC